MPDQDILVPPPVMWAQRSGLVYLSICLEDCKNPVIKMEPGQMYFKGTGGTDKKEHEVTLHFLKEIIPEESKYIVRDRLIEVFLKKKEEGPYWNHLLKEKQKQHWLKVDFHRWRDEDDSEEEDAPGGGQELEEIMRQIGGLKGGDDKPDLNDLDDHDSEDSDDENLPELE